jgi:hypothetical protein
MEVTAGGCSEANGSKVMQISCGRIWLGRAPLARSGQLNVLEKRWLTQPFGCLDDRGAG